MPPQLEPGAGSPHRCPGSFREQGLNVPVVHVQRYLLVVQPRQNVAGGIDVRVQHNPVKTVKPVPATMALQQARAGMAAAWSYRRLGYRPALFNSSCSARNRWWRSRNSAMKSVHAGSRDICRYRSRIVVR